MQESANSKLTELQKAGDDVWEDLKAGIDSSWNSLNNAFKSATSRLK
jgi:hypothetical protein